MFIADLHALTEPASAGRLSNNTISTAALYLASGVAPEKTTLFIQSSVAAHSQLARLLGSITTLGMLRRMIQFKEKSKDGEGDGSNLTLFDYPVLMAADILLYDADVVPVGDDQRQHLQLTRDLAQRFNQAYGAGTDILRMPAPLVVTEVARVMSLTDGTKKMSKSDSNDASRINMLDPPDKIVRKIKRAKTDAKVGLEFDNDERPEAHNLLTLYRVASGKTREDVAAECADMGYGKFKGLLADAIVALLAPIQQRYSELIADRSYLSKVLKDGAERASREASLTLAKVEQAMGIARL